MAYEVWEVWKFKKGTNEKAEREPIYGTTKGELDAKRIADEHNEKRNAKDKEEIEFRACLGFPSYQFQVGPVG